MQSSDNRYKPNKNASCSRKAKKNDRNASTSVISGVNMKNFQPDLFCAVLTVKLNSTLNAQVFVLYSNLNNTKKKRFFFLFNLEVYIHV